MMIYELLLYSKKAYKTYKLNIKYKCICYN